jgi:hypothetical protein
MKRSFILILLLVIYAHAFSQAPPQGINYQAVLYDLGGSELPGVDATNIVLANKLIKVRFTILSGSTNGPEVYLEDHLTETDTYGLFSLVIGQGNQLSSSQFDQIDWGTGLHFLKVEVDKDGGNNLVLMSNQQFWSVPYSLYAKYAGNGIESVSENPDGTVTFTFFDGTNTVVGPFGWSLIGNLSTNDSLNFLGTKDLQDLVIKTNDQERMRVTDNGEIKVGINGQRLYINQLGQMGLNSPIIDPTAALEIKSSNRGFLPPRMTKVQRDNITFPATGLVLFNTTDSVLEYFNGECWLPTYAQSCEDCFFDLTLPLTSGTIDRIFTDTIAIEVQIDQASSPGNMVSFFTLNNLPSNTTTYFTSDTLSGDGSTFLVVSTSIFDEPGLYPIAIQAVCGNSIQIEVFYLTIDSCYSVTVFNNVSQYNLQSVNGLPGQGTPICVVVDVTSTGTINSGSAISPSFNSGNLDNQSHVGIRNYGAILGHGGDGGLGGSLATFGNEGQDGGTAINMTCKTSVLNYGFIFGGGGGGGSVGFGQTFSIPLIGNWTLAIGAGGGGGCSLGLGGGNGASVIGFWENGENATGGLGAIPGDGGVLNVPINIPLGPATLTISPDVEGGDGGSYGFPGEAGDLTIGVSVTIPIIGTINLPIPAITGFPAGGESGFAIKKNNFPLIGIPSGYFQSNNFRGVVNN